LIESFEESEKCAHASSFYLQDFFDEGADVPKSNVIVDLFSSAELPTIFKHCNKMISHVLNGAEMAKLQ
jgi:hypothetical protein